MLRELATKVQDPVRFGDDFELDGGMSQLRRSGRVLKLERIPMEVLLFLVQQRGELVTREQIVEKIWGKDVYLDTDNANNGAIRKISSENNRAYSCSSFCPSPSRSQNIVAVAIPMTQTIDKTSVTTMRARREFIRRLQPSQHER